jgi:hypothetical protein
VTDGERWRWSLMQMAELDPNRASEADINYANFLHSQFGVQTLGGMFGQRDEENPKDSPWNVRFLSEDETIARLATGPQRSVL